MSHRRGPFGAGRDIPDLLRLIQYIWEQCALLLDWASTEQKSSLDIRPAQGKQRVYHDLPISKEDREANDTRSFTLMCAIREHAYIVEFATAPYANSTSKATRYLLSQRFLQQSTHVRIDYA